jgi:hypothetical protein
MNEGVHEAHCCIIHGCKYDDDNCPVEKGIVPQEGPCEECIEDVPLRWELVYQGPYMNGVTHLDRSQYAQLPRLVFQHRQQGNKINLTAVHVYDVIKEIHAEYE